MRVATHLADGAIDFGSCFHIATLEILGFMPPKNKNVTRPRQDLQHKSHPHHFTSSPCGATWHVVTGCICFGHLDSILSHGDGE